MTCFGYCRPNQALYAILYNKPNRPTLLCEKQCSRLKDKVYLVVMYFKKKMKHRYNYKNDKHELKILTRLEAACFGYHCAYKDNTE